MRNELIISARRVEVRSYEPDPAEVERETLRAAEKKARADSLGAKLRPSAANSIPALRAELNDIKELLRDLLKVSN